MALGECFVSTGYLSLTLFTTTLSPLLEGLQGVLGTLTNKLALLFCESSEEVELESIRFRHGGHFDSGLLHQSGYVLNITANTV